MHIIFFISLIIRIALSAASSDNVNSPPSPETTALRLYPRHPQTTPGEGAQTGSPGKLWIVIPRDSTNHDENQKTRKWLDSKVTDKDHFLLEVKNKKGDIRLWGQLTLDDQGVEEAKQREEIEDVWEDKKLEGSRAVTTNNHKGDGERERDKVVAWAAGHTGEKRDGNKLTKKRKTNLGKRETLTWLRQQQASDDLATLSQYEGQEPRSKDFVYEERAGKGVIIYVVDCGINMQVKYGNGNNEEFPQKIMNGNGPGQEDFQTSQSKTATQEPNLDDAPTDPNDPPDTGEGFFGHGTIVASKALGHKYGVAKGATLISVKVMNFEGSLSEGFELIADDLEESHPERRSKAVIVLSRHIWDSWSNAEEARNSGTGKLFTSFFKQFNNWGVPVVVSSGNHAERNGGKIDSVPAALATKELPVIVVGGSNDGDRYEDPKTKTGSQFGDELTLYAPFFAEGQSKIDARSEVFPGTSFAAPVVAGVIATYLNYDPPPWDPEKKLKPEERVAKIRDFLVSDKSSWQRSKVRQIWNGADQPAHDGAIPQFELDCSGGLCDRAASK